MDDELRKAFATLSSQINDVGADARNAAARAQEAVHGVAQVNADIAQIRADVDGLKAHVYGSSDPPPPPPAPLVRQVSEHDGEIATVTGRMLAVEAKVDKLTTMQEEQLQLLQKIVDAVGGFLGKPLVRRIAWGVGVGIIGWLSTKGWLH